MYLRILTFRKKGHTGMTGLSAYLAFCLGVLMCQQMLSAQTANAPQTAPDAAGLSIGWAQVEITPPQPVFIGGQLYARVSEGVKDPITATALALESAQGEQVVFVSCDLACISDAVRDTVRRRARALVPQLDPMKIILNATHTHEAPNVRPDRGWGVDVEVMSAQAYIDFAAERIADAIHLAWHSRAPGGISYGLSHAVIGHNRRWRNVEGEAFMYGKTNTPTFSHIEGYEDHSVNLLCTYNRDGKLTGMVVNVDIPSQVDENIFQISADYWHETRLELRKRLGETLYILPQLSAAGDQAPRTMVGKAAEDRMLALTGRTWRQEIAVRLADAVGTIVPYLAKAIEWSPTLTHQAVTVELPRRLITAADVMASQKEIAKLQVQYATQQAELATRPALRTAPRWYVPISRSYCVMTWQQQVISRFTLQQTQPLFPAEIHIIRLGELAFASNPFEYYLDYGIYIKARSRAVQTFLVQLAGNGTYVPSLRSVSGGGYGSVPASSEVGPEGGSLLAERTVQMINTLWKKSGSR